MAPTMASTALPLMAILLEAAPVFWLKAIELLAELPVELAAELAWAAEDIVELATAAATGVEVL